jgi:LmbE family N-acetylglucosaminyl deacetylase
MRSVESFLATLGKRVLVVAPHPDDESLGCGGLIALLRERDVEVALVLVSDGSMSHPGSSQFPASARKAIRASELRDALTCLGVHPEALHRFGCIDGSVPARGQAGFDGAVARFALLLETLRPRTVIAPWRRDPHCDHRASSDIVRAALERLQAPRPRLLEYAVWLDERGTVEDRPGPEEAHVHRLDVGAARERKSLAIAAHASQHGGLIVDDPGGFTLPPGLVDRILQSPEVFFESIEASALSKALPG